MAKLIVDELVSLYSFEVTKKTAASIAKVTKSMKSIKRMAAVSAGALTGLAFAMNKIIGGVDKQAKFAAGIGVTFENLQKLQFAARKAGASSDELNSFLATLAKTVTSIKVGGFNKTLFQLGVHATDAQGKLIPLEKTVLAIADQLKTKSPSRRIQFGAELGASLNITNLLGQGSAKILEEIRRGVSIGAVIPERTTAAAKDFAASMVEIKSTIAGFSRVLAVALVPQLVKVIRSFQDWILANKELIASGLIPFLTGVVDVLKNLKVVLIVLAPLLVGWVAAFAAANAPLLALGGTIAFIVSNLDKFVAVSDAVTRIFGQMFPASIDKTTIAVNKAKESITSLMDIFKFFKDTNPFFADSPIDDFVKKLKGDNPFFTAFSLDKLVDKLNGVGDLFDLAKSATSASNFPILSARTAAAESTINNDVTIHVSGAQSPVDTGIEVKKQLSLATAVHVGAPGFNRPQVA